MRLKTVNLGSWLLWEGWIWGGELISESEVYRNIESRTSPGFAQDFRKRVYDNYINADDIRKIKEWGFNSVCVNLNHRVLDGNITGGDIPDSAFAPLDRIVSLCSQQGLYVIIDMHAAPGGQSSYFVADPDSRTLWQEEVHKAQTVKLWKAIASRYRTNKTVAGYDLLGEPNPPQDEDLIDLYGRIIAGIRSVDKSHLLILQAPDFTKKVDAFTQVLDKNQIFSVHFYTWYLLFPIPESDWVKQLNTYDAFAKKMGVPVWIGEWGEASETDLEKVITLLRDPKYHFCGDAFWMWKKVPVTANPVPYHINAEDDWKRLIQNQAKQGSKTYDQIALDFLTQARVENAATSASLKAMFQRH